MLVLVDLMSGLKALIIGLLAIVISKWAFLIQRGFRTLRNAPGRHLIYISKFTPAGFALTSIFPPKGLFSCFANRFSLYGRAGSTCLTGLEISTGRAQFWFADAEAIKVISNERSVFVKDLVPYELVSMFGPNLVATEDANFRRHRGVVSPAFSEANNSLVWDETMRVAHEWFEILEKGKDHQGFEINAWEVFTEIAFEIICAAAFGQQVPRSPSEDPSSVKTPELTLPDHIPFHSALLIAMTNVVTKVLAPASLYTLPIKIPFLSDHLDQTKRGFEALEAHLIEVVRTVRSRHAGATVDNIGEDKEADLVRRLVRANLAAEGGDGAERRHLSDNELLSNMFLFVLAGHETTAHALTFALVLLALYPRVQQKLRDEVLRIWPRGPDLSSPNYKDDFPKFEYALAVFRETLRCFPATPQLPRETTRDFTLPAMSFKASPALSQQARAESFDGDNCNIMVDPSNFDNEGKSREGVVHKQDICVPKGAIVGIDVWGTHMNPLHWGPDAHTFKPERFVDTETYRWPRDAFLAFSAGPRSCIGSRFATTEAVLLLALFVGRYDILPPSSLANLVRGEGEDSFAVPSLKLKQKLLQHKLGVTLTPTNAFVRLRRRNDWV